MVFMCVTLFDSSGVAAEHGTPSETKRWQLDAGVVVPIWGQGIGTIWGHGLFPVLAGPGYDVRATYGLSDVMRIGVGAEYLVLNATHRDAHFRGSEFEEMLWTSWLSGRLLIDFGASPEDGESRFFAPIELLYGSYLGSWCAGAGYGLASGIGFRRLLGRTMWTGILHIEATLAGDTPDGFEGEERPPGHFFVWMLTARLFTGVRL